MATAAVDTSVLLARVDGDDPRHAEATRIVRGIDHGDLPTGRVTNYVALETLNWLHARHRHGTAVETYARLVESAGFEVSHCGRPDFLRAVELFEERPHLAFGDATIVAYMERTGLSYLYSFDDDFDAVDTVTRLDTAGNPFE